MCVSLVADDALVILTKGAIKMVRRQRALVALPPLPETSDELRGSVPLNKNDEVHRMLRDGLYAKVKPFLESADDRTAVTGKVMFDRAKAAAITKKHAEELNNTLIADLKESEIDHCLRVAMNRMNIGREQRLRLARAQS